MSPIVFHCAGELPPGGGPVDTVPPKIVFTYPEPNSVHFADKRVVLEFDKYVDEQSVENSVFISPHLGVLEFGWSGKQVSIQFEEDLKPSTTYVVSVGTDVVDLRNRNRLERAFSLAFSTGSTIDSGSIIGRVYDEKSEGVMVLAYRLDSLSSLGPDPSTRKPDYITQTGKGGGFSLTHLSLGPYRLFALRDEYKNLLHDLGVDAIGVYHRDVLLTEEKPSVGDVNFQLMKEDTVRPALFSARALDNRHILLRFSKPLDPTSFNPRHITVVDTLSGQRIDVFKGFVDLQNPTTLVLLSAEQQGQTGYRVVVDSVRDTVGNLVDGGKNLSAFASATYPDTSAPKIVFVSVKDSARQVPLDASFEVRFDDVVLKERLTASLSLRDSSGAEVSGAFRWKTDAAVEFLPHGELRTREWYTLHIPSGAIVDGQGNVGRDSVLRRFETIDENQFGSLQGRLLDETNDGRKGPFIIKASEVRQKGGREVELMLPEAGPFRMSRVVGGVYVLSAFRDDDGDGKYSYGKPHPFEPSEVFSVYPDTIRLRPRWPVEGILVRIR